MSSCLRNTYRFVAVLPLVFIILLVGWSYYAYVVALCIYSVPSANIAEKVCFIFFYHIFFGLFVWSYLQTIIAKPIQPPDDFRLTISEWTELHDANLEPSIRRDRILSIISERHLPVYTRGPDNSVRLCSICHLIKPDRAHHCATCGVCMLKMDHHCPWVNNCVGLHNYKYFVLFLLYGSLYCFYIGCSSAKYFVSFWTEGVSDVQSSRFHVLFLFFAAWMFSISLLALGGYHVHLTMSNLTTLEGFRAPVLSGTAGPDKRAYNVGFGRNFCQVFGDKCYMWLLPLRTWNIDGIHWQHKASYSPGQRSYSAMESGAGSPSRVVERQQLVTSQTTGETDKIWAESDARD